MEDPYRKNISDKVNALTPREKRRTKKAVEFLQSKGIGSSEIDIAYHLLNRCDEKKLKKRNIRLPKLNFPSLKKLAVYGGSVVGISLLTYGCVHLVQRVMAKDERTRAEMSITYRLDTNCDDRASVKEFLDVYQKVSGKDLPSNLSRDYIIYIDVIGDVKGIEFEGSRNVGSYNVKMPLNVALKIEQLLPLPPSCKVDL